jgi:tetratricopeptide (TPR) repeat protein
LRAALEWSCGLLTPDEQAAFRRLGVFAGSFGLDSAQHVIAAQTIDKWAALDLLGALVDKSLVVAEAGSEPRYRLLETGRAFALEQLANAGETADAVCRHAQAMLAVFERSWRERWTITTQAALERYGPDVDNLRAALDWAARPEGDADLLVALTGASSWVWKYVAQYREGVARFGAVAARVGPATPLELEARFHLGFAELGTNRSVAAADTATATQRAIECYRALGDRQCLFRALAMRARYSSEVGDIAGAQSLLAEAAELYDSSWPPGLRCLLLTARAFIFLGQRRIADARATWEEQLRLDESLGDARLAVVSLNNLIDAVFAQGDVAEAISRGRELVAMVRRQRFSGYESFALGNLSAALTAAGQLDAALQVAREGAPLLRQQGALPGFLVHFAMLAARRGRDSDAAQVLGCEESSVAAQGYHRQENEARVYAELTTLLRERLGEPELQRLRAAGARISIDEGAQVALSS